MPALSDTVTAPPDAVTVTDVAAVDAAAEKVVPFMAPSENPPAHDSVTDDTADEP